MNIDIADITDKGSRNVNEDYIGYDSLDGSFCFVVCDGLGGMGRGDEASRCVAESVLRYYREAANCFDMDEAFVRAQKRLLELQRENDATEKMKTTAVVLFIRDGKACFGHIGDTRLYYFNRDGYIRTLDHSIPQMLVHAGELKEEDIRFHEDRNKLVRVMGNAWSDTNAYTVTKDIDIEEDGGFLLCTDGFWELIDENNMVKALKKSRTSKKWISLMKKQVVKNGKNRNMDNYSAIVVRFSQK